MIKKLVLLNSGGFDSTVLASRVRDLYDTAEIINLFFNYGQPNLAEERRCSMKTAEDLDFEFREVEIPKFNWTSHKFYDRTVETAEQYVEYRNLVFLSYATSIAEAEGAERIFMALFYLPEAFKDCSLDFIENYNYLIAPSGIKVITPFAYLAKEDLHKMAVRYGIYPDNKVFFSCNSPIKSELTDECYPCGKCEDCIALKEMFGDDICEQPREIIPLNKNDIVVDGRNIHANKRG